MVEKMSDGANHTDAVNLNEEKAPLHFNTKEEYHQYYSDAIPVEEFDRIIREKYGM